MENIKEELEQIKKTLNEEARICETILNDNDCWTEVDCNVIIDLAKRLNKINLSPDAGLVKENVWSAKDSYGNNIKVGDQIAWLDKDARRVRVLKVYMIDETDQTFVCTDGTYRVNVQPSQCIIVR